MARNHGTQFIETLDARQLLSVSLGDRGLLEIKGETATANTITVGLNAAKTKVIVKLNATAAQEFDIAKVKAIVIRGGDAADTITVSNDAALRAPKFIHAGKGNDTVTGGTNTGVDGGDGNDMITLRSAAAATTTTSSNTPRPGDGHPAIGWPQFPWRPFQLNGARGGAGNDTINGSSGRDFISGGLGDDSLTGNAGADTEGGDGADKITGGEGNDRLAGGKGNDVIDAGAGNDYVEGGEGNDAITGGAGNDRLFGGKGIDTISGNDGNDLLVGGDGVDVLTGGAGNNRVVQ